MEEDGVRPQRPPAGPRATSVGGGRPPSLRASLPFFLTAPVAVGAAGLLLLLRGAETLQTGWDPLTLSLTHLCTLGFLSMAMFGAVYLLAAVVAGKPVPWERGARLFHALFLASTAAFCWGIAVRDAEVVFFAIGLLFPVLLLFIVPVGIALRRAPRRDRTGGIAIALASFVVAAVLGIWMAHGHGGMRFPGPRALWLQVHLSVAVLGWLGGLVTAVSWQVLPTVGSADAPGRGAARVVGGLLVLGVSAPVALLAVHWWGAWPDALGEPIRATAIAVLPALLAVWGLHPWLAWSSPGGRPAGEAALRFWRGGLALAPPSAALAIAAFLHPDPRLGVAFGWLALWGWAGLIVHGMLLRLVSFVAHPRRTGADHEGAGGKAGAGLGFGLHIGALAAGLAATATGWSWLASASGALVLATACALEVSLLRALRGAAPTGR